MKRPFVITVSGQAGGVGKTRLIELLLPVLGGATALKAQARDAGPAEVHQESDSAGNARKDTGRYLAAGAQRAYLVSGPARDMLPLARRLVAEADTATVVVETNCLAADLQPDLAFFVEAGGPDKPGSETCRRLADIVVSGLARPCDPSGQKPTEGCQ